MVEVTLAQITPLRIRLGGDIVPIGLGEFTTAAALMAAQAAASAGLAQEWAEGTEPGGPGTDSAKNHAIAAEAYAAVLTDSALGYVYSSPAEGVADPDVENGSYFDVIADGRHYRYLKSGGTATLAAEYQTVAESILNRVYLTLEQFGGAADYVSPSNRGTDNTVALNQALAAVNRYAPVNPRWPRVPRIDLRLGAYYFASPIDLKVAVHFHGQGGGHDDFNGGTRFVFGTGVKGVTINDSDTINGTTQSPTTSAKGTILEGVQIESEGGGTGWDTSQPLNYAGVAIAAATNTCGLWIRTACTVRDVLVKGFKGNQVQIVAVAGGTGGLRGNANGTLIDRLTVREDDAGTPGQGHGFFVCGNDVNACDFRDVQVRHAGLMGICEVGTLGNNWINPRVDDWARVARTGVAAKFFGCFYGGVNYVLIDIVPGKGAATTPGTNANVWYPYETAAAASALFPAWSNAADYVCMVPMLFQGQSNTSQVHNPYIETGVPGDGGGSTEDPGTGVTVYGGTAIFTRRTRHIKGTPGAFGSYAVVNATGFGSLYQTGPATTERTDYGTYTASRIGALPGEIWAGRTQRDGESDYAMRFTSSGELVMDRAGFQRIMRVSTPITDRRFGTGANIPLVVSFDNFALSDPSDSGNDRRMRMGAAAPTANAWARGDRVWNVNPGPGQPDYWECLTSGTPGTWIGCNVTPFQSGSASSALTGTTAETALATLTLPGGTLGPNGSMQLDALWSCNNSAGAKTLRARFGGLTGVIFGTSAGSTPVAGRATGFIQNRNNVASQIGSVNNAFVAGTAAHGTGTVNTALSQTIVITGQLATSSDTMTLESYSIRVSPGA